MILTEQQQKKLIPLAKSDYNKQMKAFLELVKSYVADIRTPMTTIKEEIANDVRLGVCRIIDEEIIQTLEQLASGDYEKPENEWE